MSYGPPLGSFAEPYENAHAMLTLEDYLVLYTDGVTEARHDGELLGERRLLEIVDALRGRSAQGVAEGVRDAALEFAGRLRRRPAGGRSADWPETGRRARRRPAGAPGRAPNGNGPATGRGVRCRREGRPHGEGGGRTNGFRSGGHGDGGAAWRTARRRRRRARARRPAGAGRRVAALSHRRRRRLGRRPRGRLAAARAHPRRHRHGALRRAAPGPQRTTACWPSSSAASRTCPSARSPTACWSKPTTPTSYRPTPTCASTATACALPRATTPSARPCPSTPSSARWPARSAATPSAWCCRAPPRTARWAWAPSRPRAASPSPRTRRAPSTTACRAPPSPRARSISCSRRARSRASSNAWPATPTWPRDVCPRGPPAAPTSKDCYAEIFRLLRQTCGVDFTHYKFSTIGRRVTRRLALRHLESVEEYVALLRDDPAEVEALFQDILIMVTEFFREPATFAALRAEVFPKLLEDRAPDRRAARLGAGLRQRRRGLQPGDRPAASSSRARPCVPRSRSSPPTSIRAPSSGRAPACTARASRARCRPTCWAATSRRSTTATW